MVVVEVPGLPPEALHVVYRERELVLSRRAAGAPHGARARPSSAWSGRTGASSARSRSTSRWTSPARGPASRGGLLTVTLPRLRERRGRETVIPVEREPAE